MSIRIKEIRKSLKMSRDEFGERLGVSRDVIANIELNRLARPEQKEGLLKLMCKEFNVNYEWLTTGEGEMFLQDAESIIAQLEREYALDELDKIIITSYLNLDVEKRKVIKEFIKNINDKRSDI